ncbi:acyl carrier protein [Lichenicoccus sp.]|uniref:acyl carrier protein n=1 Tax=Lichenicoccus sp. TaxID=2781899 RepID=UPI003D138227
MTLHRERKMPVRPVILEQIARVADEQGRQLAPLTDDLKLFDSGLDSLCFAILVARLDDELGLDPLSNEAHAFPVTIGDFIRLYEHATI